MLFKNRIEAAKKLSDKLKSYRGQNPLILAIPRGAVPMGKVLATQLEGELDVVLVHKLRAPSQLELAIGAIDESGHIYLAEYARSLKIDSSYLEKEKEEQVKVLRRRRNQYTQFRPAKDPKNRVVIVVDDGIATGSTMIAALHALRARQTKKLIVATAVIAPDTLKRLSSEADEVVYLDAPLDFYAVGQFFEDFSPVSDEEVAAILKEAS